MSYRADGAIADDRPTAAPRRYRPDAAQYRNQRNAIWLSAIEIGLPCLPDGDLHSVSVRDLAGIFECSRQTILNGLASALAIRAEIAGVDGS